jgi:L-asparaginase
MTTRGNRKISKAIEVHLLREGIIESVHQVQATICDHRGRILLVAGNPEISTFVRSSLKPFQALAVTSTGTLQHFELTDKDLAIMCSSHQGLVEQSRQVFNILWKADLDVNYLQCPTAGDKPNRLQYNCSGKHAGMLAVCQKQNWHLDTYLHRSNPIQKLILNKIAELLKMPSDEFIMARDDCGAPTYLMQLRQIATLYAHLAAGDNLDLERIVRAMSYYPRLIAGEGAFDTELMQLTEGELVSKSGAEGVQCIAKVGDSMGLAIKVTDGARRAKYAAAIQILKQMGWITPTVSEALGEKFMNIGNYQRLEVIGELEML